MEEIKRILKKLTGKNNVVLLPRCNKAIETALKLVEVKKALIQDQGGWLTYKQYPKKYAYRLIEVKTDYGLVDLEDLDQKADKNSVLLLNSMPGYHAFDRVKEIAKICKDKNCIFVNDASGSIGTEYARYGDIIVGSFGKWKPVWVGYGGFLASDPDYNLKDEFDKTKLDKLKKLLLTLEKRIKKLRLLNKNVKKYLGELEIIHPGLIGYNVIVKFKNTNEKTAIEKYCKKNYWEYTICPRYIRVIEDAVSIEVKRKHIC